MSHHLDIQQVAVKMLILEQQLEKNSDNQGPVFADSWNQMMDNLKRAINPGATTRNALRFDVQATVTLRIPATGQIVQLECADMSFTGFRARGDITELASARAVELIEVQHHLRTFRLVVPCEVRWFRSNRPRHGEVGISVRTPYDQNFRALYQRAYTRFLSKLATEGRTALTAAPAAA